MKLALYQGPPTDGAIDSAFARLERLLTASGAAGARLLLVPELFLPGYNRPDLHASMAQEIGGDWTKRIAAMTARARCGLAIGWAERSADAVHNAATAFGPDGAILAHYRKVQLFGTMEQKSFTRGPCGPVFFELDGRRIGLLVCYDVEFSGHVSALRAAGASVILVPTANPKGFEHVQRVLIPTRAYEGCATIAYANYVGSEGGLAFGGMSLVAGPDAQPMVQAGSTGEALLIVDLAAADAIAPERLSTLHKDALNE